ncbi:MAG: formyltetrahydrofolate deformylase [Spirochaeta sp. LUC14_002_19_P3]|nr:MAG: formyltetrahydrofolate deformylase [Spirochaeta sp. LUC14_002_19_P3]
MENFVIQISCPDQRGIVAAVTGIMADNGINILDLTQHTASDVDVFMLKSVFEVPDNFNRRNFEEAFEPTALKFRMNWKIFSTERKERIAVLVSQTNHCLWELLLKHQDGELNCDIPVVISNHLINEPVARQFGIPFYQADYSQGKDEAEARIRKILQEYKIDLVVMARFMQILSPDFTDAWHNRIINIHHGFLPAFQGAKPYHQAWYKGVKIIGATAHFATSELDRGPIIAQEVINVSDRSSIKQLMRMGKDVERRTLVHALALYLDHSIFVHENRTFILR